MAKQVFVTYAQENKKRKGEVLAFAERLRRQGLDAQLDQYEVHPSEGWPTWMERQLTEANIILVVASENYLHKYNQNSGVGSGGRYEAAILKSMLSKNGVSFEKIAVILFDENDSKFIPNLLHGCTRYHIERDYEKLYRWLTDQPLIVPSALGAIIELPPHRADHTVQSFGSLCNTIKRLLDDNYRLFRDFGPNSGNDSSSPLRMNLAAWFDLRKSKIVPNNRKIRELVISGRGVIPLEFSQLFDRLLSHIEVFEAHVDNDRIDYRDHQFPKEINAVVQSAIDEEKLGNLGR